MTLRGAIQQLRELHGNDDIPIYVKPAISKVIETLEMDAQEVRHGRWEHDFIFYVCSVCGLHISDSTLDDNSEPAYCPNCGAKMDEVEV